jgi:hypothetical protein
MRAVNPAGQALLARLAAGEQIPMPTLVELQFATVQRITTAGYRLQWPAGQWWEPQGLQVGAVDDSATEFTNLALGLPGVTEAQIALVLADDVSGTRARVWVALVDPDDGQVADALLVWTGELDVPTLEDGAEAAITITAEHRGAIAVRPKPARYTHDEQLRRFPGDFSLDQDPATDAAADVWPAASYFRK